MSYGCHNSERAGLGGPALSTGPAYQRRPATGHPSEKGISMRHLPRPRRVVTMRVDDRAAATTGTTGRRVLAVGRITPACDSCRGFESVKVRIGGELVTIDCTCVTAAPADAGTGERGCAA
jgi:hypothetical protein